MTAPPKFLALRGADTTIAWKNIVTDYGAVGNGVDSDFTAFANFRTWAKEQSGWVGLVMPPTSGHYVPTGTYEAAGPGGWPPAVTSPFFGIPKLVVWGYGAKAINLFASALADTNQFRALIKSVAAGSNTLELIDAGDADLFEVGSMILLAGLDLQGFGYPPNSHYNEWHRIASIDGAFLTLERPIKYGYSEDWPTWDAGDLFHLGNFGAASINRTLPGWDVEHRLYGIEVLNAGQVYYFVRKGQLIEVVQTTGGGFILGASEDMRIINQNTPSAMEVDKLTTRGLIEDYDHQIIIQSSSVDDLEIRKGTGSINGTAKNQLITGGSSAFITLGPTAYGITERLTIKNRQVTTFNGAPGLFYTVDTHLTYLGDGVFQWLAGGPPAFLVPGAVCIIQTGVGNLQHHVFRVLDQRKVGDDALIDTSLTGPDLPAIVTEGYGGARIYRHNAPDLTVTNCTGSVEALELSLAGANKPYGSFRKRTFSASGAGGYLLGRLQHLKINVTQPYTGVASALTMRITQFGQFIVNADKTVSRPTTQVNLKIAGERIITPEGVTGAQSGDAGLSDYTGGVWLPGPGFNPFVGNGASAVDISGEDPSVRPIVTVEVMTDQEIPAA